MINFFQATAMVSTRVTDRPSTERTGNLAMLNKHIDRHVVFPYEINALTFFRLHANTQGLPMSSHSHQFVETFKGLVGFGFSPESDMDTVIYYLQKFSDDDLMALIRNRLTDDDREAIFNLISGLLRKHLSEPEYHRYFLKDE